MSSPFGRLNQVERSSRTSGPSHDQIFTETLNDDALVMTMASLSNSGEKGEIIFRSSREKVEVQTITEVEDPSEKDSPSNGKGDPDATTLPAKQGADAVEELGGKALMDDYPDGGSRAWLIVFGVSVNTLFLFFSGMLTCHN